MIDLYAPVSMEFIGATIVVIFVVVALGIGMVKQAKRKREQE